MNKFNKIFVYSPTSQATGGTELLQQLVYKLRLKGQDAYLVYTAPLAGSQVEKIFVPRYNNPYVEEVEDDKNNLVIVSEAVMFYLLKFKFASKAIWWLSVDHYGGSFRMKANLLHKIFYKISDIIYREYDKNWYHLVQSEYAYDYCLEERHIPESNIFRLSDFLSKSFTQDVNFNLLDGRKNQILYNPKKGYDFTSKLINSASDLQWVPIINMTSDQISNLMKSSKVYIDFGYHPGKDRIPREAAMCGCCVITGKRGAAKNNIDIQIPEKYKFDEKYIPQIISMIKYIFNNYNDCVKDFDLYIDKIKKEEATFDEEINNFFFSDISSNIYKKMSLFGSVKQNICKNIVYTMKFLPAKLGVK